MEKIGETTFYLTDQDQRLLGVVGSQLEVDELKSIDLMAAFQNIQLRDQESAELLADDDYAEQAYVKKIAQDERFGLAMDAVALGRILEHLSSVVTAEDFAR